MSNKPTVTEITIGMAEYILPYQIVTGGHSQIRDEEAGRGRYRVYVKDMQLNRYLHVGNVHNLASISEFMFDHFEGLPDARRETYRTK